MFKFVIARLSSTNSFYLLIITGVLMSIFEAISIFSLGPFITMVLSPEVIGENEYILFIKDYLSIEEAKDFITFFGVITLISIIFGNVNNIFHQYFVHKCSYFFGRDLAFEYINTFLLMIPATLLGSRIGQFLLDKISNKLFFYIFQIILIGLALRLLLI